MGSEMCIRDRYSTRSSGRYHSSDGVYCDSAMNPSPIVVGRDNFRQGNYESGIVRSGLSLSLDAVDPFGYGYREELSRRSRDVGRVFDVGSNLVFPHCLPQPVGDVSVVTNDFVDPRRPSRADGPGFVSERELVLPRRPTHACLLYTSPSPRDATLSRMPSSA